MAYARTFNPITGIDYHSSPTPSRPPAQPVRTRNPITHSNTQTAASASRRKAKYLSHSNTSNVFRDSGPSTCLGSRPMTAYRSNPSSDIFNLRPSTSTPSRPPRPNKKSVKIDSFHTHAGRRVEAKTCSRAYVARPEASIQITDSSCTAAETGVAVEPLGRKLVATPQKDLSSTHRLGFGLEQQHKATFQPVGEVKKFHRQKKQIQAQPIQQKVCVMYIFYMFIITFSFFYIYITTLYEYYFVPL